MLQMDSEELEEASPDAHGPHRSYMVGQMGGDVGMPHKSIATLTLKKRVKGEGRIGRCEERSSEIKETEFLWLLRESCGGSLGTAAAPLKLVFGLDVTARQRLGVRVVGWDCRIGEPAGLRLGRWKVQQPWWTHRILAHAYVW